MATNTRSVDSVYEEIAELTGRRGELERERFLFIKAIRALRAVLDDSAVMAMREHETSDEIQAAIERLEGWKNELWTDIARVDAGVQKLTDLAQNGAFNA